MRSRARIVLVTAAVCALLPAVRALRVRGMEHFLATQRYEDLYYLPSPAWLEVLSLGHREALADLLWARALVYYGDELRAQGEVAHAFSYGEAILTLDPRFARAYRWVGMAGMYRAGGFTVEDLRRSVEFLERGARELPDDGKLAWDAGASIAYELLPHLAPDDPDRPALAARASEYMARAVRLGASPAWVALSSAVLLQRLGETDRELRFLEEMLGVVDDPDVRAQIAARIGALRSEAYAAAVQAAAEEDERARRRDYPYASPDLYFFLGPRPSADPEAALRALVRAPPPAVESAP